MSILSGTVKLPAVGTVPKAALAVGGAAVIGLVLVLNMRSRQREAEAGPVVDPATGAIVDPGGGSYINPVPDNEGYTYTDLEDDSRVDEPHEWAEQVTQTLGAPGLWEPSFVVVTVGKYLARQPLDAGEADLIRAAWSQAGGPGTHSFLPEIVVTQAPPNSPPPPPNNPPPPPPPPPAQPDKVQAPARTNMYEFVKQYGVSFATLRGLNPGLDANISWERGTASTWEYSAEWSKQYGNVPWLKSTQWIRLR